MSDDVIDKTLTPSEQAYQLYTSKTDMDAIAQTLKKSSRTIYRYIEKEKKIAAGSKKKKLNLTDKTVTVKSKRHIKTNTHNSSSANSRQGDKPGILLKITEEILEDALARVLESDPVKALGPALTFLDKKKSLSINDDDTMQTEEQKKYYNEVLNNIYR